MNYRTHLHTKEQLDERSLTREDFIVKRINNIKNLSVILGALNNHLSDEELRYISKTIETILNDQEDILYGTMSNHITFAYKPA